VVVNDNTKLVQATSTAPIGDVARVNYLHDQLGNMAFSVPASGTPGTGGALSGTVTDLIAQAMDFQGGTVAAAQADASSHSGAMDALNSRMTSEYGVDINSEMARLVQLQAAYSANARIVTVAQNLVDALLQAVTG
jgi:flagellar hook-associated protein 1 FlgK